MDSGVETNPQDMPSQGEVYYRLIYLFTIKINFF